MTKEKILVTGSNGQLGSELKDLAVSFPQFDFLFFERKNFPIGDESVVENMLKTVKPSFLINCAAYTGVDKAETEKERATNINGTAVEYVAKQCAINGTKLIHISTDYVFNGQSHTALKETDPVDPVNHYGASKLLGERLAVQNNAETIIIRTSWVYSSYGHNFVKTMIRLMKEKESISVVDDQHGSPTYAADLAEAIMQIISSGKWIPGIYHFSNRGTITWFEFANEIKDLGRFPCKVQPISTAEYPTPAQRPMWSVMDTSKIHEGYGVQLKDWRDSLKICMKKL
jgi:dTDP-4-dehydrorhamnose reductase